MNTLIIALATSILLAGCRDGNSATSVTGTNRVYTVDEFVAQPELRKKVSASCSNDPGRTGLDLNCVNVRRADHVASFGGTGGIPRIVP